MLIFSHSCIQIKLNITHKQQSSFAYLSHLSTSVRRDRIEYDCCSVFAVLIIYIYCFIFIRCMVGVSSCCRLVVDPRNGVVDPCIVSQQNQIKSVSLARNIKKQVFPRNTHRIFHFARRVFVHFTQKTHHTERERAESEERTAKVNVFYERVSSSTARLLLRFGNCVCLEISNLSR